MNRELLMFGKRMAEDASSCATICASDEYTLRMTFATRSNGQVSVLYYFNDDTRHLIVSISGEEVNLTTCHQEQVAKTTLEIDEALTTFKEIAEELERKGGYRITKFVLTYSERIRSFLMKN